MKIKLISVSAKRRQIDLQIAGNSYIVVIDGVNTAKFSNKLKVEVITERLQAKGIKGTEIKRIFEMLKKMGKENVREVNAKPSDPESTKTKKQLFSDATVRAVAKEFKAPVATLAQLTKQQRASALAKAHHGFGTSVRNFIRTGTNENMKVAGNPITMDDIWTQVIERAIELKLYSDNDVDVYDLARMTGTKVKELDLVIFKEAEAVKKFGSTLSRSLTKTFGEGMVVKPRVRQAFSPASNVPAHKYNWFNVTLPMNISTMTGNQTIDIFLGKGVVYIRDTATPRTKPSKIAEHKLVKGTGSEILETILKNIKVKTNTVEKPKTVGKFNAASQYVADTYGKELMAKGIELYPTKGGINFYHPRRGTVKAQFGEKNGKLVFKDEFRASFGETFSTVKRITKPLVMKLVSPLLK